jgi:hypothetical protein
MYMNITTVSELTNAKGDIIDPAMIEGNREEAISKDKWQRVNQSKPDSASWKLWKQVLKGICIIHNNKWYLTQKLGGWTITQEKMRRQWKFWYEMDQDILFQY